MTNSRKQHGIGSLAPGEKIVGKPGGIVEAGVKQYGIFKKIKKIGKKVFKSPLGKAALIGGLGWAANAGHLGGLGQGWWSKGLGKLGIGSLARPAGMPAMLTRGAGGTPAAGGLWGGLKKFGLGKAAFLGAGAGLTALPFLGGDDEEDVVEEAWDVTPSSIANIRQMASDRHPSLAFMPGSDYVQSGFYTGSKDGGIIGLANGGQPAEAQAEQMLKMEYQKYRNQGGTMSYQQFKMAVLQQAQSQGPMAQGQPQMA